MTNSQYAEFLNAVAAVDTNALYHANMGDPSLGSSGYGGITRSGSSGSFMYTTIAGRENMPVNWVSFYDSLRFANWLQNGQGTGSTETGAYTITALGITNNSITRNAGATIFLTSQDEWYKAAYYDVSSASYFDYPTGTDVRTACTASGATANCGVAVGDLTVVGSYSGSASPIGTFDQGGNVWEWNEVTIDAGIPVRGMRGGSFDNGPEDVLAASALGIAPPAHESWVRGFRVASLVPEPSTGALLVTGMLGLTGWRRRLH